MTASAAYEELLERSRELARLQSCAAVLGWDQQTYMPKKGAEFRGEQLALLARLAHEQATAPRWGELLDRCENSDLMSDADSISAANIRELRHSYRRATCLPTRLVEELARVTTAAQEAWQEARARDHFPTFQPHLERIVALKQEEADAVGWQGHRYDALLDEYEPGLTSGAVHILFTELAEQLIPLVRKATENRPKQNVPERTFPVDRQKLFAESAAAALGFDFTAGRLDITTHPFCSAFGPGDCRLTTRYNPTSFQDGFFGVLHETGHGLYEQGLPAEDFGTPCGSYCSLGVHESQSRLWENQVGRGRAFWEHFFPRLRQAFPGTLDDCNLEQWLSEINTVRPSFIRVEADELTYNLHIILRFEIERELLTGALAVTDLPLAWNTRFEKYFGLKVPSARLGCLQDIHWSFGGIGYFPTYTLGNLLAAQFMEKASSEIGHENLADAFRIGNFRPLLDWLRQQIHSHGRRIRADQLCQRVTGNPVSSQILIAYLSRKITY